MDGRGSIGLNEVPGPEGGGGATGFPVHFHFYMYTNYFRSLLAIMKNNKMGDKAF